MVSFKMASTKIVTGSTYIKLKKGKGGLSTGGRIDSESSRKIWATGRTQKITCRHEVNCALS